ncbi:unnamed protein product [Notodromas monacha]|uniref:Uncharacterized protein n=1 Tax=Notodromas monacha TaxID=399045 RepID=A0A7R9GD08_9CRUS|nr:unnamed protein product [Notodromas monacha]CAG0918038.1 unnamed protein product [Notodromas monacha]
MALSSEKIIQFGVIEQTLLAAVASSSLALVFDLEDDPTPFVRRRLANDYDDLTLCAQTLLAAVASSSLALVFDLEDDPTPFVRRRLANDYDDLYDSDIMAAAAAAAANDDLMGSNGLGSVGDQPAIEHRMGYRRGYRGGNIVRNGGGRLRRPQFGGGLSFSSSSPVAVRPAPLRRRKKERSQVRRQSTLTGLLSPLALMRRLVSLATRQASRRRSPSRRRRQDVAENVVVVQGPTAEDFVQQQQVGQTVDEQEELVQLALQIANGQLRLAPERLFNVAKKENVVGKETSKDGLRNSGVALKTKTSKPVAVWFPPTDDEDARK